MERWWLYAFLGVICFALITTALNGDCYETTSTKGKHFMFGIPKSDTQNVNLSIQVYIVAETYSAAKVEMTIPHILFYRIFTVRDKFTVLLPSSLIQTEAALHRKGIEITSDKDISVAVMPGSSKDSFLVLPTAALSTRYVAASYTPYSFYPNSILIVALENDTHAEISHTRINQKVVTATGKMKKFETYQLFEYIDDLSGAVVTSNRPVAVFASVQLAAIPAEACVTDFIVEQMTPTKFWTNKYIVVPILDRSYNLVRIFSDQLGANVNMYNHTDHTTDYVAPGQMLEIIFESDPLVITADKPVSVIQYAVSFCNESYYYFYYYRGHQSPVMVTTQGITQFTDDYKWFNPFKYDFYSFDVYVPVTIHKSAVDGLTLNGNNIRNWIRHNKTVAAPMDDYAIYYLNITANNSNHLEHRQRTAFGAFIVGFSYDFGYGYLLGLNMNSTECLTAVNTTPTPYPVTNSNTEFDKRTSCFSCDRINHQKYCDTVSTCQSRNEVCYIARYTRSSSTDVFNSGCIDRNLCDSLSPGFECRQCCNGSFCNTQGCNDPGLPSSRGLICFSCDHVGPTDTCHNVQLCTTEQVCKTEKYSWGEEYFHNMGCVDKQMCHSKRDVEERSTPLCSMCCSSDFCNTNCTQEHGAPLIG